MQLLVESTTNRNRSPLLLGDWRVLCLEVTVAKADIVHRLAVVKEVSVVSLVNSLAACSQTISHTIKRSNSNRTSSLELMAAPRAAVNREEV